MTNTSTTETSELKNTIRDIIAEVADIEASIIKGGTHFAEDLEMDSLIALEVIALIEQKYKIKIPEEDLMDISCLDNAVKVASKYIQEIHNAA